KLVCIFIYVYFRVYHLKRTYATNNHVNFDTILFVACPLAVVVEIVVHVSEHCPGSEFADANVEFISK
ncbi:hypothetical protein, partial [Klebsiella pneumoniae]